MLLLLFLDLYVYILSSRSVPAHTMGDMEMDLLLLFLKEPCFLQSSAFQEYK